MKIDSNSWRKEKSSWNIRSQGFEIAGYAWAGRVGFLQCRPQGRKSDICLVDGGGSGVWSRVFPDKPVTNYCVPFFLPRRRQYLPKQASPHRPGAQPVWESRCILETAHTQRGIRCFRDWEWCWIPKPLISLKTFAPIRAQWYVQVHSC